MKKIRTIEIKTRGLCSQLFSGEYHSAFKGQGVAFAEVREYQWGDDIRSIDWNVTARMNATYVKEFEEERELNILLLVDASRSGFFGSQKELKSDLITEIGALLSYSAIQNNDKAGAIFFTDRIEKYLPPKKGRSQTLQLIRELIDIAPASPRTDLSQALLFLDHVMKKRSVVFILSDFIASDYETELRIVARKHDVIGIHVYDERERELPDVGLLRMQDAETGETIFIDTSDLRIRNAHARYFDSKLEYFEKAFLHSGAEALSISTASNYTQMLMSFFERRLKRA
ncbi:MAG: DUF58 domain-containing protein [Chitinophagales bacterium]